MALSDLRRKWSHVFSTISTDHPRNVVHYWIEIAHITFLSLILLAVYAPVLLGHASLLTDSSFPSGSVSFGDPAAGGPITFYKELAVANAWAHLHFPWWLPSEGYGVTLAGNQAAPWFFPEIVVHLLFPMNLSIWNVFALIFGAVGVYLLCRHLNISPSGGVASGVVYVLAGPAITNLNLDMINPLMVMPYLLLASLKLLDALKSRRYAITWMSLCTFALSQLFLSGFAEVYPIELATVGLFLLVRLYELHVGVRKAIAFLGVWLGCVLVGVASSLIAIITLIQPLRSYTLFQYSGSWSTALPKFWLSIMFDPWAFGRGVVASPLMQGYTAWEFGNPVIVGLAIVGALLALRRDVRGEVGTRWVYLAYALLAYGLFGIVNLFHVLDVLSIPPLNLIASVRFLAFAWWLPLALVVGWTISRIRFASTRVLVLGYSVQVVAAVPLLWLVYRYVYAPQQSSPLLLSVLRDSAFIGGLFVLGLIVIVLVPRSARAYGALIAIVAATVLVVPKNFWPVRQAPQEAQGIVHIIRHAGLGKVATFSSGSLNLPSGLISDGLWNIQAFDVFEPKGYTRTVSALFGGGNPLLQGSPIYPGFPAMMSISLSPSAIKKLRIMGVGVLVSPSRLIQRSLQPVVKVGSQLNFTRYTAAQYTQALAALVAVYESRPDLQRSFSYTALDPELLQWAIGAVANNDSSAVQLDSFDGIYRQVLSQWNRTHMSVFVVSRESTGITHLVRYLGTSEFEGVREYIYSLDRARSAGLLFTPLTVHGVRGLSSKNPSPLVSASNVVVPYGQALSLDQRGAHIQMVASSWNSSSLQLKLRSQSRALAVVRQVLVPGESVTINGHPAKVVPVNGFLTGIVVPRGSSVVIIEFGSVLEVSLFWIDVVLNLGLLVLAGSGALVGLNRYRASKGGIGPSDDPFEWRSNPGRDGLEGAGEASEISLS
jgi:hypothetical protein